MKVIKVSLFILILLMLVSFMNPSKVLASPSETQNNMFDIILVIDNSGSIIGLDKEEINPFIYELKDDTQLGIISFGVDAKLIYTLQQVLTVEDKEAAIDAFSKLDYMDQFTNINEGLELALLEFRSHARKQSSKIVVLISDGKMDPSPKGNTKDVLLKDLRGKILNDYINENVSIYTIAFGNELDLQLMQEIADKTGGKCLIAPNKKALKDSLSVIVEIIRPLVIPSEEELPVEEKAEEPQEVIFPELPEEEKAEEPQDLVSPALILTSAIVLVLLVILTGIIIVLLFVNNRRLKNITRPALQKKTDTKATSPFLKLSDNIDKIIRLITETSSDMKSLQLDIEDYGAESWKNEEKLKEKYYRMVDNLFLLLDHFEIFKKRERESDKINWFYEKTRRILEEEGIEEIPVKKGDHFNGIYHEHVKSNPDKLPKGVVLDILLKGYYIKGKVEKDDIVLRPAKVTVSSGPSKGHNSNTNKEKEK